MQARGGLLGSDFGAAQTNNIQDNNTGIYDSIEQERMAVVNQILSQSRTSGAAAIAEKRAAKEAGGKAYLEFLAGDEARKNTKLTNAAKILLLNNKRPEDVSDAELKAAGINRNELTALYNEGKASIDAAQAKAQAESDKTKLEGQKTQAEIDKLNREASKNYEVGGIIY